MRRSHQSSVDQSKAVKKKSKKSVLAKFVDTNSARTMTVTVKDVTVVITDYTPL